MAAKGTESKNTIFNKLMEIFPDAFWENEGKILRVPMDENGNRVEVKVQLTAAKNNLGGEGVPSAFTINETPGPIYSRDATIQSDKTEMTEEEKANVQKLIQSLGL